MAYDLPLGTDNGDVAILTKIAGSLEALRKNEPTFVTTGGSANAYTATFSPAHVLATDAAFFLRIHATNTTGSTLDVNGTGAKDLMKIQGASIVALAAGDVIANGIYQVIRDQTGDRYLIVSLVSEDIFRPNSGSVRLFCDFHGPMSAQGAFGYVVNGGSPTPVNDPAGVMNMSIALAASGSIGLPSTLYHKALNSSVREFIARVAPGTNGTTNKIFWAGLTNGGSCGAAGDGHGLIFRVEAAGSTVNIFPVTKNGASGSGLETTTDSGIADGAAYRVLKIRATSSLVQYYIDNVLVASHTTNIPTDALGSIVSLSELGIVGGVEYNLDAIYEDIPGGRPA